MDNRRQNFGTVVTTEGMWMIGGLFESASDLPTRKISKRFNIPGKLLLGVKMRVDQDEGKSG